MSTTHRADIPAELQRIGHVRYTLRAAGRQGGIGTMLADAETDRADMFRDAAITAMGCASTLIALALAIQTALGA
jgi:hypothetical protein